MRLHAAIGGTNSIATKKLREVRVLIELYHKFHTESNRSPFWINRLPSFSYRSARVLHLIYEDWNTSNSLLAGKTGMRPRSQIFITFNVTFDVIEIERIIFILMRNWQFRLLVITFLLAIFWETHKSKQFVYCLHTLYYLTSAFSFSDTSRLSLWQLLKF